jgi:hypothetical protein
MTRVLILLGAGVTLDTKTLGERLNIEVKKNQYVEGVDDEVYVFECPNRPEAQEVDLTIKVGLCSEHDDFDADMVIDESGDVYQEIYDVLIEEYAASAEGVADEE